MPNTFNMKTLFLALLAAGSSVCTMAQSAPNRSALPDNRVQVKAYMNLKDSRSLSLQGEVIYLKNDSVTSTLKAKWNGAVEVIKADGRTIDVAVSEEIVENMIIYSDLVADIFSGQSGNEFVVKMDKLGNITEVVGLAELMEVYVEKKERDKKAGEKMGKEERVAFVDTLKAELTRNSRLEGSIKEYAKNFLGIYGKVVPTNSDTVRDKVKIDAKRFFSQATKNIDADYKQYISDVKPGKFTLNEEYQYIYKAMDEFLVAFGDEVGTVGAVTKVVDLIQTQFDSKTGWPVKLYEELTVTKGPYKVIYKWNVRWVKDK